MNEELTKELLSILRAMKDGAPHAWQTLVEQRSSYCLTHMAGDLILAFVGLVIALVCLYFGTRSRWWDDDYEPQSPVPIIFFGIALCGLIAAGVNLAAAIPHAAEGMAPLGRVLEAIR